MKKIQFDWRFRSIRSRLVFFFAASLLVLLLVVVFLGINIGTKNLEARGKTLLHKESSELSKVYVAEIGKMQQSSAQLAKIFSRAHSSDNSFELSRAQIAGLLKSAIESAPSIHAINLAFEPGVFTPKSIKTKTQPSVFQLVSDDTLLADTTSTPTDTLAAPIPPDTMALPSETELFAESEPELTEIEEIDLFGEATDNETELTSTSVFDSERFTVRCQNIGDSENPLFDLSVIDSPENQKFYRQAKQQASATLFPPAFEQDGGKILLYTLPVYEQGRFLGALGIEIQTGILQQHSDAYALRSQSDFLLISPAGIVVSASQSGVAGKHLSQVFEEHQEQMQALRTENHASQSHDGIFRYYEPLPFVQGQAAWQICLYMPRKELQSTFFGSIFFIILVLFLFFVGWFVWFFFYLRRYFTPFSEISEKLRQTIGKGHLEFDYTPSFYASEIEVLRNSYKEIVEGLKKKSDFATEIGKGNLEADFEPLSPDDMLGNSLLEMRKSLQEARQLEQKQKAENQRRNWTTHGLAHFGDILRKNTSNLSELSYDIVSYLVQYLKANQGGIFIHNDDSKEEVFLELKASYAYNRRKYHEKKILPGEGLIGACALEKETIFLTEIPQDYINISSGLGKARPNSLLIVPLKMDDKVLGVLEIASFEKFKKHEIEFVEELAEDIASTLSAVKISERTTNLLEQSRQQAEEMAAQEEEMRQNLEELQATQEESARREAEMSGILNGLNKSYFVCQYDKDGNILEINDKFTDLLGTRPENLVGENFLRAFTNKGLNETWAKVTKGQVVGKQSFYEIPKKWLSETYTPIFDNNGKLTKVLNIAFDITHAKEQEAKLEAQAKQLKLRETEMRGLLESVDKALIAAEYDLDGTVLRINQNFSQTLGYAPNEVVGKKVENLLPQSEKEAFRKTWQQLTQGESFKGETRRQNKQGKEIWLLTTYSPVKNEADEVYKIYYIGQDITQTKQLQIEANKQAQKLADSEAKMRSNIQELEKMRDEMAEKQTELEKQKKKLQNNEVILKRAVTKLKEREQESLQQQEEIEKQHNESQQYIEKLEKQTEQYKTQIARLEKQIESLKKEKNTTTDTDLQNILNQTKEEIEKLKNK